MPPVRVLHRSYGHQREGGTQGWSQLAGGALREVRCGAYDTGGAPVIRAGLLAACLLGMLAWVLAVAFPSDAATIEAEWVPGRSEQVRLAIAVRDYQQTRTAAPQTRAGAVPLADPCRGGWPQTRADRARCWIDHSFPPAERETAFRVAYRETGEHLHPWQENYDQFLRETGRWWTPERARIVPAGDRHGWQVFGLFQHRWSEWERRSQATISHYGLPAGVVLDPFDGWHNTLVASWLAGWQGWSHWDVCAESAPSDYPNKFRCGAGRWLR